MTHRSRRAVAHLASSTMVALALSLLAIAPPCRADNPIVRTRFTADPAPLVHGGRLWLYTSHDEDDATGFKMFDWLLYSTTDLVNWTDHGTVGGVAEPNKTFRWAQGSNAWAPQAIEHGGKFYLYCPVMGAGRMDIGVAVADRPTGPFTDPIGRPLIHNPGSTDDIDPTVFVDDDGQAYLYWGHQRLFYVKLNPDLVSYSGGIVELPRPSLFEEGPWFYRRGGHYYLAFASYCCPEGIGYAMSDSPTGPWTTKGHIMKPNGASSGNHPGIVDYQGKTYVFGFNYALNLALTTEHRERRSVCASEMTYAADGTIPEVPWWSTAGVAQVGHLDPYVKTEAETMARSSGVRTEASSEGGMDVSAVASGAHVEVKGVDFGAGAASFRARVASATSGGAIELRLDGASGARIGTCAVPATGGSQVWTTVSCDVAGATGVHDLFLVFTGGGSLFNVDWWQFEARGGSSGGGSGSGGASSDGGTPSSGGSGASSSGSGASSGGSGASSGGSGASGGGSGASSGGSSNGGASSGSDASSRSIEGGCATGGGSAGALALLGLLGVARRRHPAARAPARTTSRSTGAAARAVALGSAILLLGCGGELQLDRSSSGGSSGGTSSGGTSSGGTSSGGTSSGGTSSGGTSSGGTSSGGTSSGGTSSGGTSSGGTSSGGTSSGGTSSGGTSSGGTSSGGTSSGGTSSGGTSSGGTSSGGSSGGNPGAVKSAGCGAANAPRTGTYKISAAGLERTYILDVPPGYDPNTPHRLVFAWHPLGGTARAVADGDGGYYGLKPLSNGTAIFVAGDGIDNGWPNYGGRDIAFTKAMVERLESELCIDRSRIFSMGWSFGGMFSFAIGCDMADVFRAIGPASGALISCDPGTHPIAMWGAHGLYDGFVTTDSGRAARDVILARNHCSKTTSAKDANGCVAYQGCDAGYPVVWCEWPGGHSYPEFARAETWKFFAQF